MGLNHQTAPLELREKLSVSRHRLPLTLSQLKDKLGCGVLISTCNRLEIYLNSHQENLYEACISFIRQTFNVSEQELNGFIYTCTDQAAVEHLFRVTSGLDSMLIGEYEVLGQVKTAYKAAEEAGVLDLTLRKLFESALSSGRRIREETAISHNALSISSVAVSLAEPKINGWDTTHMLVIGTGEASRLVIDIARGKGLKNLVIASRHAEKASIAASEIGAMACSYEELDQILLKSDVVIAAAVSSQYILNKQQVINLMGQRQQRPLLIIDIGVPRNIDPEIGNLSGVTLYNIDHLLGIAAENRMKRENEINRAIEIIESDVAEFMQWYDELKVRPLIRSLTCRAESIRSLQTQPIFQKLSGKLSAEDIANLDAMTKSIVNRILKEPIGCLKQNPDNPTYAEVTAALFNLKEPSIDG
jgi:glutamyl-tRNA reductase